MIDVNNTIYKSIQKAIGMLRFQAIDDSKTFRAILELIILDDVMDWAKSLDLPQKILEQLIERKTKLILCNPAFDVQYDQGSTAYTNVNTPQTSSTWKRIWDQPLDRSDLGDKEVVGGITYTIIDNLIIDNTLI